MSIQNALASVAVKDLAASAKWYEVLLGRPPSRSMAELAEWRFEHGGWLQVYQLPERAGAGSFTLSVTNLDEQIAKLDAMQMNTQQRTASATVRTVMITDPDGNHIAFAEALDASAEH